MPNVVARALLCIGALFVASCGGKALEGRSLGGNGGAATASGGGDGAVGGSVSAAGFGAEGGTLGGGAGTPSQAGQSTQGCFSAADCPAPKGPCSYATCVAGACGVGRVDEGTFVARADPPDCFDRVCDGLGGVTEVLDYDAVPASSEPCATRECGPTGELVAKPVAAGAPCTGEAGKVCDGMGSCVECLKTSDCAVNQACSALHTCAPLMVAPSCMDAKKDGDETDIDCGGSCAPCASTKQCYADSDCATGACDAQAPARCLANHCADHHWDFDEADIDCGGSCPACADMSHCRLNQDCQSANCNTTRAATFCVPSSCKDGVLDTSETDVDCGGGACDPCPIGEKCFLSFDCVSVACDGIAGLCDADPCADHTWDGQETDLDCGGLYCSSCTIGKRCKTSFDCASGLVCSTSTPHVCLPR